jgi:hypothetical protein
MKIWEVKLFGISQKVLLVGFSICAVCITLSGIMHLNVLDDKSSLIQSNLFLGDEAHLMREMALSWRDKQSLRNDQGESELPSQNLDFLHARSSVLKQKPLAKYIMLASPSKSILTSPKKPAASAARAVHQAKSTSSHALGHVASASEHAEANSLVNFADNLAQEIVRR